MRSSTQNTTKESTTESSRAKAKKGKRMSRIVRKLIGKNGEELYFESPEEYPFTLSQLFRAYRARMKEWSAESFIKWLKPRSQMRLFTPKRKLKKIEEEFALPGAEPSLVAESTVAESAAPKPRGWFQM